MPDWARRAGTLVGVVVLACIVVYFIYDPEIPKGIWDKIVGSIQPIPNTNSGG